MAIPGASTVIRKGGQEVIERLGKIATQMGADKQTADYMARGLKFQLDTKAITLDGIEAAANTKQFDIIQDQISEGAQGIAKGQKNAVVNGVINPPAQSTPRPEPPPVHNITKADEDTWKREVLAPFIKENEAAIRENKLFTNQNIGEIIEDNQLKRVSTTSIEDYLADDFRDIKKLKLKASDKGKPDKRAIAADIFNSPEAINTLKAANDAFKQGAKTATGKRAGVNPEWLNPESLRAGQTRGANFARQIFNKIRKIPGFEGFGVEQGHPIDLLKSRGVDAMAGFGPETAKANKYWNRKDIGGTILNPGATEELGIARGADFEAAGKIKSEGPLAKQRKAEYEQLGVLTEIWNQALIATETKGQGMKKAIAEITKHRNAIRKGDYTALRANFKLPGSQITIDDMLAIQILALKTGDPTSAAERVIGERMAFEWAKAQGLVDNPDTLKVLKQYMKHINTEIDVRKAKEAGPKKFRFTGKTPEEIQKAVPQRSQVLPRGPAQTVNWNE